MYARISVNFYYQVQAENPNTRIQDDIDPDGMTYEVRLESLFFLFDCLKKLILSAEL